MKRHASDLLIIICFVIALLVGSIPFKQEIEVRERIEYDSLEQNHLEIGFGGPSVTWVTVLCNRTAEIRFMYQEGVWISTQAVLLDSFRSTTASYNFKAEHSTNIVDIQSNGPFHVLIIFTYTVEAVMSFLARALVLFEQ